jgi:hypothetical protein
MRSQASQQSARFGHVARARAQRVAPHRSIFMAIHKRLTPITEVHLALTSNSSFEDIVAVLKQTLTVPELPGFKGCRPCLSGLDRFIVEDIAMQSIR